MRKSTVTTLALALLATFALLAPASAAVIGDWPSGSGNYWEDQPIPGYTGGPVDLLSPPSLTTQVQSQGKYAGLWLPYNQYPAGTPSTWTGERLTTAGLILNPGDVLSSVHLRVYDSATTGRDGWAAILKDTDGNILDFGIRGFWASAAIISHQFEANTLSWDFGPTVGRNRSGNDYYSIDFSQNPDGTINWTIDGLINGVAWASPLSGTTTVAYGDLSGLYVSASTSNTTGYGRNYRWTEFSYTLVPEPGTGLTLACGLGLLFFISRLRRR
jgi:hypothetical protein